MPAAMTATFIRIGNLMNSEILGKPTDGSWGFVFSKVDSIPRHPAQLYESASYFLIFVALFCIYKFTSLRQKPGFMFGFGIGTIFLARIFIEFFKENQEAFEQGMLLNMGQLLSIPFVMICYYMAYRAWTSVKLKNP
jgi:prolipoprotein diacylglyceryltransferase